MKRLALLTPAVALIAACSGSSDSIQPGQWEMTTRMTEIDVPGAPEALANQMRTAMANQAQTESRCITPEEAANPTRGMMNPTGKAEGCTFTDQTFAGGAHPARRHLPRPGRSGHRHHQSDRHLYGDDHGNPGSRRVQAGRQRPAGHAAHRQDDRHDDRPAHGRLPVLTGEAAGRHMTR